MVAVTTARARSAKLGPGELIQAPERVLEGHSLKKLWLWEAE